MARPTFLRLDDAQQAWRAAPMPGANSPLELVRLESSGRTFAILGRFPEGFERPIAGSYAAAEEFIVLRGGLELGQETAVEPGMLCFIPAHHPRSPMRSPNGCTVLAWFSGPPAFRPARQLTPQPVIAVSTAAIRPAVRQSELLRTSEAAWRITDPTDMEAQVPTVDVIDLGLTWWARVGAGMPTALPIGPVLARVPLA